MEQSSGTTRLLVVSRDVAALRPLWSISESNSWQLETASSAWEALERVQSGVAPHLLILDMPRGDRDSLHILRWLRRLQPQLSTILLCHAVDADARKDALRMGADDVLVRPLQDEHLKAAIYRYLDPSEDSQRLRAAIENVEPLGEDGFFVSASPVMQKLREQVEMLAQADVPVLILGEKGSGKKTVARLIHSLSVRSGFKFVKANGMTMPDEVLEREIFGADGASACGVPHPLAGKIELAEKGTFLFEELSEIPDRVQAKLLGVLKDGCFTRCGGIRTLASDVRILATSSANLERVLEQKRLRDDFYYRMSAFTVHVPPLRQRKDAIPIFLQQFMHSLAKHYGLPAREFSQRALESCEKYWWPGNVEELEKFVKRYLVAGESELALDGELSREQESLPGDPHSQGFAQASPKTGEFAVADATSQSLRSLIRSIKSETERNAIGVALEKTGWNRKAAARLLQVSYRGLLYKIEQYHIHASESFFSPLPGGHKSGAGTKGKAS